MNAPSIRLLIIGLVLHLASPNVAVLAQESLNEANEIHSGTKVVHTKYQLLVSGEFVPDLGLRISWVDPSGPGAWMSSPDGRTQGILERGDVVTAVNGRLVFSNRTYFDAINATHGNAKITVRDINTGRDIDWFVKPVPVRVFGTPERSPDGRATALKVLLIGDTDDDRIGEMIQVSIGKLRNTLRLSNEENNTVVLTGRQVSANSIIAAVDRINVRPTEAFVCYLVSHGAYDPNRATNDVSGGHFFALRGGDLMRKTLIDRLRSKGARLTVLISDTCNVRSSATPKFEKFVPYTVIFGENPVLANLFLDHIGVVDISGSSRDEYGWFSTDEGGWFTSSLVALCKPGAYDPTEFVGWDRFVRDLSSKTSQLYNMKRRNVLEAPGNTGLEVIAQLRNQSDQRPQVFLSEVQAQISAPRAS